MSDPQLSDEEISAIIDGEADADVIGRFQSSPDARERADALRAGSDLLREELVDPLSPAVVDDLVANALAAMDVSGAGSPEPEGPGPNDVDAEVLSFVAPARSNRRRTGPNPLLVAAAVVVLAGIGLALVWSGTRGTGTGGTHDLAGPGEGAPTEAPAEAGSPADSEAEAPALDHLSPSGGGPVDLDGFVGEFDDHAELRAAINEQDGPATDPVPAGSPDASDVGRCAEQANQLLGSTGIAATPSSAQMADVDGTPTLVLTFPPADGPADARALVVFFDDLASCRPERPFIPDS